MNRAEDRAAAERLLASVDQRFEMHELTRVERLLAALVHATLAAAEVTPMPEPAPAPFRALKNWTCTCSFLPHPHIWGASCPPHRPISEGPGQQ